MEDVELCKWLRDNSSGGYRNSELSAYRIEELKAENNKLISVNKRLWEELGKQGRMCSDSENRLGDALNKIKAVINEL